MCWKIRRNLSAYMGGLAVGKTNTEHRVDGQSISATQIKLYDSHLNSSSRESLLVYQFSFCCKGNQTIRQSVALLHTGNQVKNNVTCNSLTVDTHGLDIVVCPEITLAAVSLY